MQNRGRIHAGFSTNQLAALACLNGFMILSFAIVLIMASSTITGCTVIYTQWQQCA
jgi:hypothetical protein